MKAVKAFLLILIAATSRRRAGGWRIGSSGSGNRIVLDGGATPGSRSRRAVAGTLALLLR
jgi:hypothetical protein